MTTLLKISQMLLGGCALLLFAGALPRAGVPAIYHGGAMLLLGLIAALLCLWGGIRLIRRSHAPFALGALFALLSAASAYTAYLTAAQVLTLTQAESISWLPFIGYLDLCLVAIVGLIYCGLQAWRRLVSHHWLALAHLSFLPLALGVYLDYCFEMTARVPVIASDASPIDSIKLSTEKTISLGFELTLSDFQIKHYDDAPFVLYEQVEGQWNPLGKVTVQGDELVYGEERWQKNKLEYPAATDNKAIMLIAGEPARVILQQDATVKEYSAQYHIQSTKEDSSLSGTLSVNKPIEYRGWQFSLMNYHHMASQDQTIIQLEARHAPGRFWARAGMIALIVSLAAWCWLPTPRTKDSPPQP